MATRYVLDTNILTALLRYEPKPIAQAQSAWDAEADILLCPVVFYEALRGLLHRDAKKQVQLFLNYTTALIWDEFNQADWDRAAQLWAELRRRGEQTEDADLLIGVYALQRGAIVVTDNEKDFIRLGVAVENWRR